MKKKKKKRLEKKKADWLCCDLNPGKRSACRGTCAASKNSI